ncbi:MAG TPA: ABC transporter permease [Bryobacteraceae bacterium]|nr:ABC transporter permease [Bryobacteraceae bacterium]
MLRNDILYAFRLMRRSPGFTTVAVLSLALGIGANTAIFSLFYTIMLRQLPVDHPEQLVQFLWKHPGEPRGDGPWSWEQYELFRDQNHVFSAMTGMTFDNLANVRTEGGEPEALILENVLGNYFQVLGLKPAIGRFTGPEDAPAEAEADAVVVSWSYWNRIFHRDPSILGKRIWYEDRPKTIVGVAPRAYVGPRVGNRTDVWMPYQKGGVIMLARLRPGVARAQAEAEMNVLERSLDQQHAAGKNAKVRQTNVEVEPAGAGLVRVRDQYGKALVLLMAVVGLLLLLACINLASLLLARSAGRQREMAVRVGLGASRGRLMKQMLTESVLLSAAGTLVGVVLAYLGTGVLVRIMASDQPHQHVEIQVRPDIYLLLFTTGIALLTGLLFGLAPAWHAFRSAPASGLRTTGRGDTWFWRWFGKGLVAAQVALSILLVTAAAVFLSHLSRMRNLNMGFRSDHVLLVTLDPARSGYKPEQLGPPYQELLARFESIPGVRSAAITGCTPMEGCGAGVRYVNVEGFVERPEDRHWSAVGFVGPRYFETLGIPLIAGRDFSFRDRGRPRVAIVSESMARHYFPGSSPIGKRFVVDRNTKLGGWFGDDQPYEIVGVVGDAKGAMLREGPFPAMYFNVFQEGRLNDRFALRTSVDPASVAGAAQRMVRDGLPSVRVRRVRTLEEQIDSAVVPERLMATLSEFFGVLGVVIAGIGLYGLLTYTVARRTNEIGVRMALGATLGDVSQLVLRDALGMVCAGLVVGSAMVLWSRPLAVSLIRDLKPESAVPLALAGGAIVAVALAASYVPARRAARVDPMVALRHE